VPIISERFPQLTRQCISDEAEFILLGDVEFFFLSAKMARNYSERLDFAQMLSKVGRLRNFCQTAPEKNGGESRK